jgi:outer membrane protein assembly factor BamA
VSSDIGFQYLLIGGNHFKVFYKNKISNLLSSVNLKNLTALPEYGALKNHMYGSGIKYEKLDYRLNPRKGFFVMFNLSVGTKEIVKHDSIPSFIYDNVKLKTTQYEGEFDGSYYIPLRKRSTFKIGLKTAGIIGENVFQNELYRIGGLKTLRGFNEEEIYATSYAIVITEIRYLLEQNSYVHLFFDGAYYENITQFKSITDTPFGFGFGVSFETKPGILSLNYALGHQFNNPILLKNSKIHFGIVSHF